MSNALSEPSFFSESFGALNTGIWSTMCSGTNSEISGESGAMLCMSVKAAMKTVP